jgi:prevent-host-death family protein
MDRMGVRELRQNASTWVRRAAAGETLEVTDRGRPVARLGPIPSAEHGLDQLVAAGRLTSPRGRLSEVRPLASKGTIPDLSSILIELRSNER